MTNELLENELSLLNTKEVGIVRKGFGTQSDCWYGHLYLISDIYPVKFHFISESIQIIFESTDVIKIDPPKNPDGEHNNQPTIRLKGPEEYCLIINS